MLKGLGNGELNLNTFTKIDTRRSENLTPTMKLEKEMKNFKITKQILANRFENKKEFGRGKKNISNKLEVTSKLTQNVKREELKIENKRQNPNPKKNKKEIKNKIIK